MFKLFIIFGLLVFTSVNSIYGKDKMDQYYNSSLGEKKVDNYHGPLDPSLKIESHFGETKLKDDVFIKHFGEDSIEDSFFDLSSFWSSEVMKMNSCPNFYLDQNIDYIRYLYRLVTISYLFESIKEQARLSYRLGFSGDVCSLDWNTIFSRCKPETGDMKKFIRRSQSRYLTSFDTRELNVLKRSEKDKWIKSELPKIMKGESLTSLRLQRYCRKGKCHSIKDVKEAMKNSCQKDRYYINTICSEKDSLYGVSWATEPTDLLTKSHVMRILNKNGFAKACLERYVTMQKGKEVLYPHLQMLFAPVFDQLVSSRAKNLEGELFLPGALKEFDDRGLEDFLFVQPKVIVKKEERKSQPKPVVKIAPKPKPKPKPVIVQKPKPEPKAKPRPLSTFEKTRKELVEKRLKSKKLDMGSFQKDFVFNKKMIKSLKGPVTNFQKRGSLNDMLAYDKLGSRFEPVTLLFLKFLIDQDMHSGLWNIVSVIGNDFYVINDIENKSQAVAVRLKNDETTNNEWQITLIREDQIKKKGAK